MAFTHEGADSSRSNSPGGQNHQENDRSCSCSGHFRKLYPRPYGMRKLVEGLFSTRRDHLLCPHTGSLQSAWHGSGHPWVGPLRADELISSAVGDIKSFSM